MADRAALRFRGGTFSVGGGARRRAAFGQARESGLAATACLLPDYERPRLTPTTDSLCQRPFLEAGLEVA
jgi:hypothetical protein